MAVCAVAYALQKAWKKGPVHLGFRRIFCSLLMSLELLLVLSMVCMMLRLLPGSWDMFASHSGLSWTGPANKGDSREALVDGSSWGGGREGGEAVGRPYTLAVLVGMEIWTVLYCLQG